MRLLKVSNYDQFNLSLSLLVLAFSLSRNNSLLCIYFFNNTYNIWEMAEGRLSILYSFWILNKA